MTFTEQNVADFYAAGAGSFWWLEPDTNELLTTDSDLAPTSTALFLMDWNGPWFAQWGGDWVAAADQLNMLLDMSGYRGE